MKQETKETNEQAKREIKSYDIEAALFDCKWRLMFLKSGIEAMFGELDEHPSMPMFGEITYFLCGAKELIDFMDEAVTKVKGHVPHVI